MATRTISTRLAIDGSAEYKQKIADVNRELKNLGSELKLVESEFRGNANSVEALSAKGTALSNMYEKQKQKISELEDALKKARDAQEKHNHAHEEAKAKVAEYEQQLAELKKTEGDTSEEQQKLQEELKKWREQVEMSKGSAAAAGREIQNLERQYNNAKVELNNLSDEIDKNNRYMDEAAKSADGCARSIDEFGNATKLSDNAVDALATTLQAAGVAASLREIAQAIKESVDASVEFESSITGVYKTVDGTPEQLQNLSDGIKRLSTEIPATTTEIAAVAEVAGQLGIETPSVMKFTEVMLALGYSTDVSAEEAATSLAQLANIVGTSSDDYERLGSTVVALGNNFATQESKIIAMSQRLAASGKLAGMTEAEIMALATAMSSVGIEAEAGGTAMSQTMTQIEKAVASGGESLEQFATIAGVSSQEFADMWNNNAIGAIQLFISGLGDLEAQGESATLVLDEMGLTGIRQSNMIKSLALANETLTGAVSTANTAWQENTALAAEAGKRYATTESAFKMCGNAANNLKISVGDVLAPSLKNLAQIGEDAFTWASDLVEEHPGIVSAITGVVTAIAALASSVVALQVIEKIQPLLAAFNATLSANPAILVTSAILGLVAAFAVMSDSTNVLSGKARDLTRSLNDSKSAYDDLTESGKAEADNNLMLMSVLKDLIAVEDKTAGQKAVIANVVDRLNASVPGLAASYNQETDALNMTTEAMEEYIETAAEQKALEEIVDRQSELYLEQTEIEIALAEAELALKEARDYGTGSIGDAIDAINQLRDAQEENKAQQEELQEQCDLLSEKLNITTDATNALADAYQGAYNSAYESVTGQQDLFGELNVDVAVTVEEINQSLANQATALDEYATNMQIAIDRGVNQGLVQTLSDGSARSMEIMRALAGATDGEIAQINASYANVQTGADSYSTTVAGLETGTNEKMASVSGKIETEISNSNESLGEIEEGVSDAKTQLSELERTFNKKMSAIEQRVADAVENLNVYTDASAAGADTIQGYIDGAESMRDSLVSKFTSLARAANAAYQAAMEQNSPSRLFRRNGRDTIQGAILGSEDKRKELEKTYASLAEAAIVAYQKATPRSFSIPSMAEMQREQTTALIRAISGNKSGDTYVNITSPKAMDERTAAREFKRVQRNLSLGVM